MKKYIEVGYRLMIEPEYREVTTIEDDIYDGMEGYPKRTIANVLCRDRQNCIDMINRYFDAIEK